ncbi:hypothetical protein GCM10025864_16950 [Luteimicrobium album]|uniref:NADP-dependent oxidoreductase domain-containing protein n=1 Tax=Luteimicrobium album TaxID=1054550 RepID=A0ABQ6HZN9_9MICO|nr:hypothetical protein GCM10025864_16950 [Luteimicrobium album]
MKTITLPGTEITAPNVVAGMMRIADKTDDEIRTLVRTARDAGIDFFDHADIYGGALHKCEERFAEALALTPSERAEITLQTKCGIVPDGPYFDFSYEHIVESVEGRCAPCRPTTSTSCCCTAPTPSSSPTTSRRPSTSSTPRARSRRSASPTTRPDRSSCCGGR